MQLLVRIFATTVMACICATPVLAVAQTQPAPVEYQEPRSYCYQSQCFESLSQAENAMRTALGSQNGALLELVNTHTSWNPDGSKIYFKYEVPLYPPSSLQSAYYTIAGWGADRVGCTPSDNPAGSNACADEQEGALLFFQILVDGNAGWCDTYDFEIVGEHASPVIEVNGIQETGIGVMSFWGFDRNGQYKVYCPGWGDSPPDTMRFGIQKSQTFQCPPGFKAVGDRERRYKDIPPAVSESSLFDWPYVCRDLRARPTIVGVTKQVRSCPAKPA